MNIEKLRTFYETHVKESHYSFQVKKCTDSNCQFHEPIRVPQDEYEKLKWLPMPELGPNGSYASFENTYGNEPHDKNRPGHKKQNNKIKKPTWPLAPQRARMIIKCSECQFPRILYSKLKLTKLDTDKLNQFFDKEPFVCGNEIPSDELDIQETFQFTGNYCKLPISSHYYKLQSLPGYELTCEVCLNPDIDVNGGQMKCGKCLSAAKNNQKRKRQ